VSALQGGSIVGHNGHICLYHNNLRDIDLPGTALAITQGDSGRGRRPARVARTGALGEGPLLGGLPYPESAANMSDFAPSPAAPPASERPGIVSAEGARRALNVAVAALGLVIAAPLMLLVAMLVKLDSRGPVVFRQLRVGLDRRTGRGLDAENRRRRSDVGGRLFTMYKFRTMTYGSEGPEERWASEQDRRVTRVGRFLRATRLDELPQLVNVLKGDMNIVGPRPEQPTIFQELRRELGDYQARQKVLPGITGWAQVNLGYDTSIEDVRKKVELDLEYIERRSARQDLAIMARTMPVMVFRKVWM
jgi:lipopolysaccharide/colanic/teichoic acid biosynthesis glycosyltransferase